MERLNCRNAERGTRDHCQSDFDMWMPAFSPDIEEKRRTGSRAQLPILEFGAPGSLDGVEDG
jgi:hypothetical protein